MEKKKTQQFSQTRQICYMARLSYTVPGLKWEKHCHLRNTYYGPCGGPSSQTQIGDHSGYTPNKSYINDN